jgi:nucleoside-specific outer membrane channel protein Tsx
MGSEQDLDKKNISTGKQTNNSLKSYPILEFELDLWYGSVLDSLD